MVRLVYHFGICNFYETATMGKFIKRTLQSILGLIVLIIVMALAYNYSEKFAIHKVALECRKANVIEDQLGIGDWYSDVIVGSLRKDYIRGKILLNWVNNGAVKENGLNDTISLKESSTVYQGVKYDTNKTIKRILDRNTLKYNMTITDKSYPSKGFTEIERFCKIIPRSLFEQKRKEMADATKKKQKI